MDKVTPNGGLSEAAMAPKLLAVAASIVAALAVASGGYAGSSSPAGKYRTAIKSPAEFKGTWILNLAKSGTYTVSGNGHVIVRGKYSTAGSKITFGRETGSGACAKSGTYTWAKIGTTLRFTRRHDSPLCRGRIGVLAHTFSQQP
jgi:hypothetical protein